MINESKPNVGVPETYLNIGGGFRLLVGSTFKLIAGALGLGGMTNSAKASIGETWGAIASTWASETRTWQEASQLIENNSKPYVISNPIETDYTSGGTSTEITGANSWSNLSGILGSDNIRTSFSNSSYAGTLTSNELRVTNFGFTIPLNATVTGIDSQIELSDLNGGCSLTGIRLLLGTRIGGSTVKSSLPQIETVVPIFPPSSDPLWQTNLRPIDINSSDFGICLKARAPFGDGVHIDDIQLKITYTIPLSATFTNQSKS